MSPRTAHLPADWQPPGGDPDRPPAKKPKYGNRKVRNEHGTFDSQGEWARYSVLLARQARGLITDLQLHPSWPLVVNGVRVGRYTADYRYVVRATGEPVVEDFKGVQTEAYRLRARLMLALHRITVQVITERDIYA